MFNAFFTARLANCTLQEQGNSPSFGRHMGLNTNMNVQLTLHYVGTCAGDVSVGARNSNNIISSINNLNYRVHIRYTTILYSIIKEAK